MIPQVVLETGMAFLRDLNSWITEPIFTIGSETFSIANVLKLLLFCIVVVWIGRIIRRTLVRRVFPKAHIDEGTGQALSTMVFYGFVVIGMLVGFEASGINVSALTVLFGAIGVGVGFGLQTIASNFISGLIILFEKPIRIGDRIEVGGLHGQVQRINARATEIRTNDGIDVIIPNSDFVSQRVINWSHGDDKIRVRVTVGVAYGSDVKKVREALLEAAQSVEATLKEPPPKVRLKRFGDSSLDFELLAWTEELLQFRGEFASRLNFAIHDTFEKYGIQIPFPQRDLHLRSGWGSPPPGRPAGSD